MRLGETLFLFSTAPEARLPQTLAQPMEDRRLLKRPAATPTRATLFPSVSEARLPQTLAQPMKDRRLLKRPAATPQQMEGARPLQMRAQPMEDRQLLKQRARGRARQTQPRLLCW